jgi:hypothetical protein
VARYERSYTGERRTEGLRLMLTPTERQELEAAADRAGASTLSEFVRELVFRRLGTPGTLGGARRDPEATAIIRALDAAAYENNAAGNNLNQIARHANTTGELGERLLAELDQAIELNRKVAERHIAALDRILELHALRRAADAA